MPLDPQAHALIASMAGGMPVEQMTVQEIRDGLEQRARLNGGVPEPVDQVIAAELPGPAGAMPARSYTPPGSRPMPGLVYFHGYAERLCAAGTPAVLREYPGMVHGFVTSAGVLDSGKLAIQDAAAALRDAVRVSDSALVCVDRL